MLTLYLNDLISLSFLATMLLFYRKKFIDILLFRITTDQISTSWLLIWFSFSFLVVTVLAIEDAIYLLIRIFALL